MPFSADTDVCFKFWCRHDPKTHDPWDERYIYLHEWSMFMINVGKCTVGKYTIHGPYGETLFETVAFLIFAVAQISSETVWF